MTTDTEEIEKLRFTLSRFALVEHVRLGEGGGTVPNGWSCKLCGTEGDETDPVRHNAGCLLIAAPPPQGGHAKAFYDRVAQLTELPCGGQQAEAAPAPLPTVREGAKEQVERLSKVWFEAVRGMTGDQKRVDWNENTPDALVAKEAIRTGVRAMLSASPPPQADGGESPPHADT